jgi:hypothetical protein
MSAGCSTPPSDIVATSTESTGEYQVVDVRRSDRLFVRACIGENTDPERVGARLVQQLVDHGYAGIDLELIAPARGHEPRSVVTRITWSPTEGRRQAARTEEAGRPCPPTVHGTSS